MRVRFWGVRGSVPFATRASVGYGCNTPCIEVLDEVTDCLLVLDAGSGIVGLGDTVSADRAEVPILLTHYHWDHVQGLPFFAPLYRRGAALTVWAPLLGRHFASLEATFEAPFFPVPYDRLPSRPAIQMVTAGALRINGFDVTAQPLKHPGGAFAYRIRGTTGDLVYATDHESGDHEIDAALARFAKGARAIIMDAHFTPDELPSHVGWGHGSWQQCAEFAAANDIGALWLFHHKPGRTDDEMSAICADARRVFRGTNAAREGACFNV